MRLRRLTVPGSLCVCLFDPSSGYFRHLKDPPLCDSKKVAWHSGDPVGPRRAHFATYQPASPLADHLGHCDSLRHRRNVKRATSPVLTFLDLIILQTPYAADATSKTHLQRSQQTSCALAPAKAPDGRTTQILAVGEKRFQTQIMKQSNSWLSGLWRAADMASRSASPASADDERHAVVSNPPSPTQLTGLVAAEAKSHRRQHSDLSLIHI